MTTLSERLEESLTEAGKSLADVAKAAGVSYAGASQWKTGETKRIRAENLFPIARILSVNPEWLATGKGPKKEPAKQPRGTYIIQSLDDTHKELIKKFDSLSPTAQAALLKFLESLS